VTMLRFLDFLGVVIDTERRETDHQNTDTDVLENLKHFRHLWLLLKETLISATWSCALWYLRLRDQLAVPVWYHRLRHLVG